MLESRRIELVVNAVEGQTWKAMHAIHQPRINLAILRRPHRPWRALQEILDSDFRQSSMVFEVGSDATLIAAELDHVLDLQSPDSQEFYTDLIETIEGFAAVAGVKFLGIKFERIDFDNCKLFHTDRVRLRLITTYSGPGTEWLADQDVAREGLGKQNNDLVLKPHSIIRQIPAQSVAITKGSQYPGCETLAVVHRSPALIDAKHRLLLRIDALETGD